MNKLTIDGQVDQPRELSVADLRRLAGHQHLVDVQTLDAKRRGVAIKLDELLKTAHVKSAATHIGLHATRDDFHASIPLSPIRDQAVLIFEVDGQPLPDEKGGPFRFYIPDHAACHTAEIDECANVKYLDRIELTVGQGFDNRPDDDEQHARLHRDQSS